MNPETRSALEAICAEHDVPLAAALGKGKFRQQVAARHACYRWLYDERDWTVTQIAKVFSRDPSGVTLALNNNGTRDERLARMRARHLKIKAAGERLLGARRAG